MDNIAKRWDRFCRKVAQDEINKVKASLQQMSLSGNYSGGAVVSAIGYDTHGNITISVFTDTGETISGIQPGSKPVGVGAKVTLNNGKLR